MHKHESMSRCKFNAKSIESQVPQTWVVHEKTAERNRKHCEKVRGVPLRVLYCPFCKGWHLTHKHANPRDDLSSA